MKPLKLQDFVFHRSRVTSAVKHASYRKDRQLMGSKKWLYHNRIMMSHMSIQASDRVFRCRMHVTNPVYNITDSAEGIIL